MSTYGQKFPMEALTSHITRANANYHAVFGALQDWSSSNSGTVDVTLNSNVPPYFVTYSIPTKAAMRAGANSGSDYNGSVSINAVICYTPVAALPGQLLSYAFTVDPIGSEWDLVVEYTDSTRDVMATRTGSSGVVMSGDYRPSPSKLVKGVYASSRSAHASVTAKLVCGVRESLPKTPYARSTAFYSTSDYRQWPYDTSALWAGISPPIARDTTLSTSMLQAYSAAMVFDHAHADVHTVNFIRYDGPDLDQGLCLYLPVMSGGMAPADNYTFEFHISIYPTLGYTGSAEPSLTANMAHVYIYNVPNMDCFSSIPPIARLGQARTTSYRVSEGDITVPNKPTNWYVKVAYSANMGKWMIVNLNQLDDHVLSPGGFVDPVNGTFGSYQSSHLPTYQDPFGAYTLRTVDVSGQSWENLI